MKEVTGVFQIDCLKTASWHLREHVAAPAAPAGADAGLHLPVERVDADADVDFAVVAVAAAAEDCDGFDFGLGVVNAELVGGC